MIKEDKIMRKKEVIRIIKKGEVKMPYAKNKEGKRVHADNADFEPHFCEFCDLEVYKKTLEGTNFFIKFPHTEHKHPICREIEKTGKYHAFQADDKPESFISKILHEAKHGGGGGGGTGGPHTGGSDEVKRIPFSNLLQILNYVKVTNNPLEKIGSHELKDFFLYSAWIRKFVNSLIELGARIVHVKFDFCDMPSLSLVFNNYWYNKEKKANDYQVKFRVTYLKRVDLESHRRNMKNGPVLDENSMKMVPGKKREVLLASPNWERVPRRECEVLCKANDAANCQNCIGMYSTEYYSKKQIVVLPEDK